MNEPDPISEIELLSRNFLSQNSNLEEFEDVDTAILSPRRIPVGRSALNDVTNADREDDDDQTNSSGFSSSIPKTVQDIDGVLNEIRLRSSPDPNDFIFRSGNRQYYNGEYYDDDTMTEKSYQTNSNLYMELNKAHESFMESFRDTAGLNLMGSNRKISGVKNNAGTSDIRDHEKNDSTIDLSWLRSKALAANSSYDSRKIKYDNNHIDAYENSRVHSPDKIQIKADGYNRGEITPDFESESYGKYPLEIRQNSDSSNDWHELSHSEDDVEDALSRVNRSYRRRQRQKERLNTSNSSSRKATRMYWVATACSTAAILFVVVGAISMSAYWSKYEQLQNSRSSDADNPTWMDSKNTIVISTTSQIEPSTIFVDGSLELVSDSPPMLPVSTSSLKSAPTTTPSVSDADASNFSQGGDATDMGYVSSNIKPVESGADDLLVSSGNINNTISKEDSASITPQTPTFASLPIVSGNTENMNHDEGLDEESTVYVATNEKEVFTISSTPKPSHKPSRKPTKTPTGKPTFKPTKQPTGSPTNASSEVSIETPTKKKKKKAKQRQRYRRSLHSYPDGRKAIKGLHSRGEMKPSRR